MRNLLFASLLFTMAASIAMAAQPADGWLYYLSEQGANWDGWVYRAPLANPTTASSVQLNFTAGARAMTADNHYVYWGLFNGTWYVARASHDLTDINYTWLMMDGSVCGKGLIYAWAVDTIGNVLWYQGQADYVLCALNMTTMTARNYGKFAYNGGGGMNGQMQLYRDTNTNAVTGVLWGVEQGEMGGSGCILFMDVTHGPSTPRTVNCGLLAFPRAGVVLPNSNTTLVGGYNTAGQLYALNVFSGANLATYTGGATTCNAAVDPVTSVVYIGSPGAASVAGIYALAPNATTYSRIIGPGASCSYCICNVAVARTSAPPPPPPPPSPAPSSVPYVQWVIPLNGSDAGGYMLYVAGSGFVNSSALACKIGRTTVPASQYIASDLIGCVVPESPIAGQARIAVANDGKTFSTQSVYFTYIDDGKRRK